MSLPTGLLLTYYGDDFTGSTDVLQVFCAAGLEAVLFFKLPTKRDLAKFPNARVVGLAGMARAQSPAWMDAHLPAVFEALHALGAPILHYKVCSTFDSSPTVGSIGRAIDIGVRVVGGTWSPTIVGSPSLKRYQAFGHLFAKAGDIGYRLDRHPTMSQHPVTPMHESDLAKHLAQQTQRRTALIDFTQLGTAHADDMVTSATDCPTTLIDVMDETSSARAGALVWNHRGRGVFSASSSGLPTALVTHWRTQGWIAPKFDLPTAHFSPQILVVSGSCSPATAQQILWARDHGFEILRLVIARALTDAPAEIEHCKHCVKSFFRDGKSAIVFSALGTNAQDMQAFRDAAKQAQLSERAAAEKIGAVLGEIARVVIEETNVRRMVVAGGDSSGAVMNALNADALTIAAHLAPGAPLCRVHSHDARLNGLEVCLKGGQMGAEDFFGVARGGKLA